MSRPVVPLRTPGASAGRRRLVLGCGLGVLGLLVVVAGTFLPWLTSGGVQRNSYAVLGIVRRLRFVDGGPTALAISLWPLLGTVAMVPILAGIVRWWRTAAVTALVFSLLTGVGSGLVLAVAGGHRAAGIGLSATGPAVTVSGAAVAVIGAVLVLVAVRRARRATAVHLGPAGQVSAEPGNDPFRPTADSAVFVRSDGFPRRPPHSPQDVAETST